MSNSLPFSSIGAYPNHLNGNTVLLRMLAGLGFRFHWVTEGLSNRDLDYKPSEEAMTTLETLNHMCYLVHMMKSTADGISIERGKGPKFNGVEEIREFFLNGLQSIYNTLSVMEDQEIEHLKIKYESGSSTMEYPFWHFINGPLSDALYHLGQIASFRRSRENPVPKGVNVFLGEKNSF